MSVLDLQGLELADGAKEKHAGCSHGSKGCSGGDGGGGGGKASNLSVICKS